MQIIHQENLGVSNDKRGGRVYRFSESSRVAKPFGVLL
jgi:hypothetical protein